MPISAEVARAVSTFQELQTAMLEIARDIAHFPLPFVREGVQSVVRTCIDEQEKNPEVKSVCEKSAAKLNMLLEVIASLEVAKIGIEKAFDKYREWLKAHPEEKKSNLIVGKNAGRVVLTDLE